ncbi:hypothetical protein [Fluviispira vulneris]|nr:hypothetical protein [Fluviispira vulneris]
MSFRINEKIDDIVQAGRNSLNKLTDEIVKSIGFSKSKKRCVEHS